MMSSSESEESNKSIVFNSSTATLNATQDSMPDKEEQQDANKDQQQEGMDETVTIVNLQSNFALDLKFYYTIRGIYNIDNLNF